MTLYDFLGQLTPTERMAIVPIIAFIIIVAMLFLWGSPDCPQGLVG